MPSPPIIVRKSKKAYPPRIGKSKKASPKRPQFIPFPLIMDENEWKEKKVSFTASKRAEYKKGSEPYKFTYLNPRYAPVKVLDGKRPRMNFENFEHAKVLFQENFKRHKVQQNLFAYFPGNAPRKPDEHLEISDADARYVRKRLF
jgi:hypothetical protein